MSDSDSDDVPLSSLKNEPKYAKKSQAEEKEEEDDEDEDEDEDEDDDEDEDEDEEEEEEEEAEEEEAESSDDDVPLKALTTTKKRKKDEADVGRKKKKEVKEESSDDEVPLKVFAKRKKKKEAEVGRKKKKPKKVAAPAQKKRKVRANLEAIFFECQRGRLMQHFLRRWWYAVDWPGTDLPRPEEGFEELDGFPGVHIATSGPKLGKVVDHRDQSKCPCFKNLYKKPTHVVKELALKAIDKQLEILVTQTDSDTPQRVAELKKYRAEAAKVNCAKADLEAAKAVKAYDAKAYKDLIADD